LFCYIVVKYNNALAKFIIIFSSFDGLQMTTNQWNSSSFMFFLHGIWTMTS
jgi:hypothetical protein